MSWLTFDLYSFRKVYIIQCSASSFTRSYVFGGDIAIWCDLGKQTLLIWLGSEFDKKCSLSLCFEYLLSLISNNRGSIVNQPEISTMHFSVTKLETIADFFI